MPHTTRQAEISESCDLIPRLSKQGYSSADVRSRRQWLERRTGVSLNHAGRFSQASDSTKGNIENLIGMAQVPLGVAGPLRVEGEHAQGIYYVPMATTEGALVRSYERGMMAITKAGGASVRISHDANRASPAFIFATLRQAHAFAAGISDHLCSIRQVAESTTQHGKLLSVDCHVVGREVIVDFNYFTADAHGMNMISRATEAACKWIVSQFDVERYYVLSGGCSEKRSSGSLFRGGKGKYVSAAALLPRQILQRYLHATARQMHQMWQTTTLAQLQAATSGANGHFANGLAAIYIACGQDVANVVNGAVGITTFEVSEDGGLYASVNLPSLTVATVGGGTGLASSQECLAMLGCAGTGRARKFAEIVAATILAGELSFGASLASSEFVGAHEKYGRNRPRAAE